MSIHSNFSIDNIINDKKSPLSSSTALAISQLPDDLLQKVFSHLSNQDTMLVLGVNKTWKRCCLKERQEHELNSIKTITEIIKQHLTPTFHHEMNESHEWFIQDRFNPENLFQINACILGTQKRLIRILQKLDVETLKTLEKSVQGIKAPKCFKHLFHFAEVEQQLKLCAKSENEMFAWPICTAIIRDPLRNKVNEHNQLVELDPDLVNKNIKTLYHYSDFDKVEEYKLAACGDSVRTLARTINVDQAIKVACLARDTTTDSSYSWDRNLIFIHEELMQSGKSSELKTGSKTLFHYLYFSMALALSKIKDTTEAETILNSIPDTIEEKKCIEQILELKSKHGKENLDDYLTGSHLKTIIKILTWNGDIHEAMKRGKQLTTSHNEDWSQVLEFLFDHLPKDYKNAQVIKDPHTLAGLKHLSLELAKQGKFDKAIELAQGLSSENKNSSALKEIFQLVEEKKEFDPYLALKIAKALPVSAERTYYLCLVYFKVEKAGDTHLAKHIANSIRGLLLLSELKILSLQFAKNRKFDEAFNLAERIASEDKKIDVLKKIFERLDKSEVKNFNPFFALQSAKLLPIGLDRNYYLCLIAFEAAKKGDFEVVKHILNSEKDLLQLSKLKALSLELARNAKFDQALSIIEKITIDKDRLALINSLLALIDEQNGFYLDFALRIVKLMPVMEDQPYFVRLISFKFAENGNFKRAIEIANSMEGDDRIIALEDIRDLLIHKEQHEAAQQITQEYLNT